jgi:hypothetical protein
MPRGAIAVTSCVRRREVDTFRPGSRALGTVAARCDSCSHQWWCVTVGVRVVVPGRVAVLRWCRAAGAVVKIRMLPWASCVLCINAKH